MDWNAEVDMRRVLRVFGIRDVQRRDLKPADLLKPASFLLLMHWWVVWGFLIVFVDHPIRSYTRSYLPYFVVFGFVAMAMMAMTYAEWAVGVWARLIWPLRCLYAWLLYVGVAYCSMQVLLPIEDDLEYFDGDAGGSILLGMAPSAVGYPVLLAAGLVVGWFVRMIFRRWKADHLHTHPA